MLFLLWWCFDDTLAFYIQIPGLGDLPLWVVFLMAFCKATPKIILDSARVWAV